MTIYTTASKPNERTIQAAVTTKLSRRLAPWLNFILRKDRQTSRALRTGMTVKTDIHIARGLSSK
jgi:hypothetical protein